MVFQKVTQSRFISFSRERQVVRDTGDRIQGALGKLLDLLRSAGVDSNRYATALRQFSSNSKFA